jgi:hypothetical protein
MLAKKLNRSASVICWTSLLRQQFYAWLRDGCGHTNFAGGMLYGEVT